ncbi:hypothetical protein DAEQUDRAFT_152657 [Daedalea quercina L-15889]|uniref:Uncharacterized protein n=1 Tax=Daedalea quercina L-15889 TaxID=1314783 RepID=A0A165RLV7_9APHY|nr:hypothetical protein DAEQUDRAFT_152657 [Daedalea quercina L-15889]
MRPIRGLFPQWAVHVSRPSPWPASECPNPIRLRAACLLSFVYAKSAPPVPGTRPGARHTRPRRWALQKSPGTRGVCTAQAPRLRREKNSRMRVCCAIRTRGVCMSKEEVLCVQAYPAPNWQAGWIRSQ